ncbi:MAG: TetR family transcriptional regulator [Eubacterium sp.]|jgi:AcrR family transcriptional regulator
MASDVKQLIGATLVDLITEKSFEKITVKEVADECHITRQTFYYYFHDLVDALEWVAVEEFNEIVKEVSDCGHLDGAVKIIVERAYRIQPVLRKIMATPSGRDIEGAMNKAIKSSLSPYILQIAEISGVPLKAAEILVDFITYGIVGLILHTGLNSENDVAQVSSSVITIIKYLLSIVGKAL